MVVLILSLGGKDRAVSHLLVPSPDAYSGQGSAKLGV